ncbi:Phosphoethanolamine transferase EptA [Candidatus Hepatincola sp. Pdp]
MVKGKIDIKTSNYVLLVTFYIAVVYNFFNIPLKIQINSASHIPLLYSIGYIVAEFLVLYVVVATFLFLFSFSRILLKFWVFVLIIISTIVTYYTINYHIVIEEVLLGTILEANIEEVSAVISLKLIIFFICLAILPISFFVYKIRITRIKWLPIIERKQNFFSVCKVSVILCMMLVFSYILQPALLHGKYVFKNALSLYTPVNYIAATYMYVFRLAGSTKGLHNIDISKKYPFSFSNKSIKKANITIILVIGESARADHQSLNGYKRDTNPNLEKVKNLVTYPNVYSCGTLSRISVTCILSRRGHNNLVLPLPENNMISAFNSLGFKTYFLSTQTMYDSHYNYFYLASKDANTVKFINKLRVNIASNSEVYDEILLKEVDKIQKQKTGNKLIVLYLVGSHLAYNIRYPKEFKKFTPDNLTRNVYNKALINSYDNTILYTDYILSKIIEKYRKQRTFLYYVSDHGESLGEGGVYYHGAKYEIAPKEQRMWHSLSGHQIRW